MDFLGILNSTVGFVLDPVTFGFSLAALGLALHFGFAGLLNMGMAAFMALGAYGYAIGILTFGLPWYIAALLGPLAAVIFAIILGIPTLRLRGDYLAIVTIAAAEIMRLLFLTTTFGPVTGSADGLSGHNSANFWAANPIAEGQYDFGPFRGSELDWWVRLVGFGILCVAVAVVWSLVHSPWGRVLKGIREDEDAIRSLGKNVFAYKMQALIIGGILGSLGGLVLAMGQNVNPNQYVTSITFYIWTALLLGGAATVFGPLVGSIIFWVIQAFIGLLMPALASEGLLFGLSSIQAAQIKFILVGLALVLIVVFRPQGIFGNKKELTFVK
jgi:ABC-type branched-subunit amino acid transport system permease subunit